MKCKTLRRLIADGGPTALAGNRAAEDHLVECSACYAVLEAMAEVERLLSELPSLDVADDVVAELLANPELRAAAAAEPKAGRLRRLVVRLATVAPLLARANPLPWLGRALDRGRRARVRWGIVAVPAVVLVGVVAVHTLRTGSDAPEGAKPSMSVAVTADTVEAGAGELQQRVPGDEKQQVVGQVDKNEISSESAGWRDGDRDELAGRRGGLAAVPGPATRRVPIPDPTPDEPEPVRQEGAFELADEVTPMGVPEPPPPEPEVDRAARLESELVAATTDGPPANHRGEALLNRAAETSADELRAKVAELEARVGTLRDLGDREQAERLDRRLADLKRGLPAESPGHGGKDAGYGEEEASAGSDLAPVGDDELALARAFVADRNRVDGLPFREPRGYWSNTYVPGDRTLRQLKARLDRAAASGEGRPLHDASRQISQPFDPPDGAALAVYLHGDRRGVEARERMLVQVGLQGTSRRSGVRPALKVGLVLDLRGEVDTASATSMRALLQAFAAATDPGDRFSLTVAGRPGGTVLPPGDLRRGPLTVALANLFGDSADGQVLSLEAAVAAALTTVRADDDPDAPLGSSAIVVITAQRLGGDATLRLAAMAHQSAVDGVPWSVVGVGQGVDLAELDALVLAGQGNRRLLTAADAAEALVGRELAAVSRVVARAVRLRIRLAPGVQLVDVIGSERLDERRAQEVRDAEQSIDQRLARNLGIQVDRGLDEEGIQIVIPSFYADDAHVVLLDVVVPGAGPVADVTVRYKDLVHMKNGVARAHLRVGRSEEAAGPLERNVLTNLLATEVASRLDRAADAAATGNPAAAAAIVRDALRLVRGLTGLVDGLEQDPDLAADIAMLESYATTLATLTPADTAQLCRLADSLRYAGRLKVLPPPVGDDEPAW